MYEGYGFLLGTRELMKFSTEGTQTWLEIQEVG